MFSKDLLMYKQEEIVAVPRYTSDSSGTVSANIIDLNKVFKNVTKINDSSLRYAFTGATIVNSSSVSFPKLTSVSTNGLDGVFSGISVSEFHFKSAARSSVEAATGYSSKFGSSNSSATIYFDL